MGAGALTFLEPVELPACVSLHLIEFLRKRCHQGLGLRTTLVKAAHLSTQVRRYFLLSWLIRVYCGSRGVRINLLCLGVGLDKSLRLPIRLIKQAQVLAPRRQFPPRVEVLTVRLAPLLRLVLSWRIIGQVLGKFRLVAQIGMLRPLVKG